jgi:hypothetical protein
MTNTSPGEPRPDPVLLEQLRQRFLRDDSSWFEQVKALTSNPFARDMARLLGIDLAPMDQTMRAANRVFETIAKSVDVDTPMKWSHATDARVVPSSWRTTAG